MTILREDVTCTLWPADLYAQSETTLDSKPFSYRTHPHGHVYFIKEFLCSHTLSFIVHLELGCCLEYAI